MKTISFTSKLLEKGPLFTAKNTMTVPKPEDKKDDSSPLGDPGKTQAVAGVLSTGTDAEILPSQSVAKSSKVASDTDANPIGDEKLRRARAQAGGAEIINDPEHLKGINAAKLDAAQAGAKGANIGVDIQGTRLKGAQQANDIAGQIGGANVSGAHARVAGIKQGVHIAGHIGAHRVAAAQASAERAAAAAERAKQGVGQGAEMHGLRVHGAKIRNLGAEISIKQRLVDRQQKKLQQHQKKGGLTGLVKRLIGGVKQFDRGIQSPKKYGG